MKRAGGTVMNVIVVVGLAALVFGGALMDRTQDEPAAVVAPEPVGSLEDQVRAGMSNLEGAVENAATRFFRSSLKAPSTASFEVARISPYGFYQWIIMGTVDAQNSFGAKLRKEWSAVVRYRDNRMDVIWTSFEGETSGPVPGVAKAPRLIVRQGQASSAE